MEAQSALRGRKWTMKYYVSEFEVSSIYSVFV